MFNHSNILRHLNITSDINPGIANIFAIAKVVQNKQQEEDKSITRASFEVKWKKKRILNRFTKN